MNPDQQTVLDQDGCAAAPSSNFIHAISEFLDTDPSDLLQELGYYKLRTDEAGVLAEPAATNAAL